MPNGFWYAGGTTHRNEESIPSSAFSKGDILTYSSSSLSRHDTQLMGADIAGIALADSIDSIDDKVPFLVPGPLTELSGRWNQWPSQTHGRLGS